MKHAQATWYGVFDTEMGWVAVVAGDSGVIRMSLPERTFEQAYDHVRPEVEQAELDADAVSDVRVQVTAYCAGKIDNLDGVTVDMSRMSPFFRKAREACRTIPAGETRTYAWLAEQAGNARAARGAGQAMAKNPVALVIPCHRVIGSDGA
ncbi:MAG: methylated-DNA--[protein]-cysteine S-methyltransferase, partial [Chloroflexi bacterium]|nr:methylated-DNA--[protein]-cysteine S-methyltransferase [Chloroflexota bacterium]